MGGGSERSLARQTVRNDRGYVLITIGVFDRVVQPIVAAVIANDRRASA
jgi:hypothetical protein